MTEENNNESLLEGVEAEQQEVDTSEIEIDTQNEVEHEKLKLAERPEGLDDAFWDDESKSVKQDDLIKALKSEQDKALGLRRKLSEKGSEKPPKSVNEYVLDESLEEILPEDSPVTSLLKEKALESGLSKDKFTDFIGKLMPALKEEGMLTGPELSEEEQKAEYEEFKKAELEKLGENGPKLLQKLSNWGQGMVNTGALSRDELPVFNAMVTNADSITVLGKIMAMTGELDIPVKTTVTDGLPSRAEIDSIIASEAYDKGDPVALRKVQDYFEAIS